MRHAAQGCAHVGHTSYLEAYAKVMHRKASAKPLCTFCCYTRHCIQLEICRHFIAQISTLTVPCGP